MQVDPTGLDVAEMQLAVAQAYAARGDSRRAQRLLELAGKILEGNRRYASGSAAEMN